MSFCTHHILQIVACFFAAPIENLIGQRIFIRYDYLKFGAVTPLGISHDEVTYADLPGSLYTTDYNYATADHYSK